MTALITLALTTPAAAQPMGDAELHVTGEAIVVARFAAPDERIGPLAARRLSSRRKAESLARAAIHRFVDEALDAVMAQPDVASRVHERVAGDAVEVRVRPMVDGSAVAELRLPLAALREAAPLEGVPW